jgi:hypothetical protein
MKGVIFRGCASPCVSKKELIFTKNYLIAKDHPILIGGGEQRKKKKKKK